MNVTRLEIELLILDELPQERRWEVQAAMDLDPALADRVERVRAEVGAVVVPAFSPPDDLDESTSLVARRDTVLAELPTTPAPANRWWGWATGGAAVLAVAASVLVALRNPADDADPHRVTYRGSLSLDAQIVRQGLVSDVGSVVRTRPGDLLQWQVLSDSDGHLTVVDLQDDGLLSVWRSAPIRAGRAESGTVELDGYGGAERVWFVVTEQPWDPATADLPTGPALIEADTLPIAGAQRTLLLTGAQ